jgi:hypothetical protein
MTHDELSRINGDRERPQVEELRNSLRAVYNEIALLKRNASALCTIPGFSLAGATMVAAADYQLEAAATHLAAAYRHLVPDHQLPARDAAEGRRSADA